MLQRGQARPGACCFANAGQIVPNTATLQLRRSRVNQKPTRKPFVAPQLREEASLADVTLITGAPPSFQAQRHGRFRHIKRGGHRHGGHNN
jgi:hypothetical protein